MKFISYHGTTQASLNKILEEGFKPYYGERFGKTFGRGIYTSKDPCEAVMYAEDCNEILVCEIETENYIDIKKKKKNIDYDLYIIENGIEYLVTDLSKIKVIGKKKFECDIVYNFGAKIYKNIIID